MALRLGAILLASCQLISGSVIGLNNLNIVHLNPLRPVEQYSHHREQNSHGHEEGRNWRWASPRQREHRQASSGKVTQRHQEHSGNYRGDRRVERRESSSDARRWRQRNSVKVRVDNSHRIQVQSPKPSVVVSGYVIGQNAVREHRVEVDSDKINVNKTPVRFGSLRYVDNDSDHGQTAKAPITVVTVPEISTARTTQHKVATNQVINQSNIPSVKEYKNRSADQLLFNYNNLGTTKIQPVTAVPKPTRSPTPPKVRSELVKPGKLQKVVAVQLAVAQRNENAPIVINKFLTTSSQRVQVSGRTEECESNDDHSPIHKHSLHVGIGH